MSTAPMIARTQHEQEGYLAVPRFLAGAALGVLLVAAPMLLLDGAASTPRDYLMLVTAISAVSIAWRIAA